MKRFLPVLFVFSGFAAPAFAAPMLFQPQNPAVFADANPNGSAALLASTVRPRDPRTQTTVPGLNPAQIVQQSVLGQISANINDKIFNSVGNVSDVIDLGNGSLIAYTRAAGVLQITFTDPRTGNTTISLPGF